MARILVALTLVLLTVSLANAQARDDVVPRGWVEDRTAEYGTVRYVSPDGQSFMAARAAASTDRLDDDMDAIAFRDGERITYQRRGGSWLAVSGFKGNRIFYRKSHLACRGQVWHHVELEYPAAQKRRLDSTVTKVARGMTGYKGACPPRR
jgi:hypothetical protein